MNGYLQEAVMKDCNRTAGIAVAVFILMISVLFLFPRHIFASKMKIKKMNYSALWREYLCHEAEIEPLQKYPYEFCFRAAAREYGLPLTLLLALARGESDFNPRAKSSKSCYGIMQINWPDTARDLGFRSIRELYNPCRNIKADAGYLKKLLRRYNGDLYLALAAYNYGPGRIPIGAQPWSVPRGADWYSGYIYHHLQYVLTGAQPNTGKKIKKQQYKPGSKIPVILFHSPFRARSFLAYFKTRAPDLRLDWFRTTLGETYIVLVFNSRREKKRSIMRMRKLGYYLNVKEEFQ